MVPFKHAMDWDTYVEYPVGRATGLPGTEGFGRYHTRHDSEEIGGLILVCPGCRALTSIAFYPYDGHHVWSWNGDEVKPTCAPSIIHAPSKGGCGWHGHLIDGEFRPC